jgi:hypothetical protein
MHHSCEWSEKIFVNYNGWVDLLDIDNVRCFKDDKVREISTEECYFCEKFGWALNTLSAQDWERINGELIHEDRITSKLTSD